MERYQLLIKDVFIPDLGKGLDIAIGDGIIKRIDRDIEPSLAEEVIKANGKLALPTFANVHTHVPMSLLRGIGADLPLMDWLQKVIWPLEGKFVSPEFVLEGTLLSLVEMIRSGTTLFLDMYFFEESVAEAVQKAGIRAGLGFGILDFPTKVANSPKEYIERARRFVRDFKSEELVFPVVCPHSAYTCSPKTLTMAKELASEEGVLLHIHVAETRGEVEQVKGEYGKTPIEHLESVGILGENLLCAHMVWLNDREVELIKEYKVKVAHCPESNLKLASGIAPIPKYLKGGITVGLGTDGAASNDNLDMLEELSTMAKLHKGANLDAKAMDAKTALRIATENGFSIAGIKAGRLEEGYEADIMLVDTDVPHLQPLYDPIAQVVYSAKSTDIDTVICKGKVIMEKREIKTLDEEEILHKARKWREKIQQALN
jgi:5-methylthioadenosine/S-adenosylhomocysteine deaminase